MIWANLMHTIYTIPSKCHLASMDFVRRRTDENLYRDQRSLSNRADLEAREQLKEEEMDNQPPHNGDPTAPAKFHGNKPSRGAEIDAELQRDDELRLQEKGIQQ